MIDQAQNGFDFEALVKVIDRASYYPKLIQALWNLWEGADVACVCKGREFDLSGAPEIYAI